MIKTNIQKTTSNAQHRLPLYRRAWFLVLLVLIAIAAIVCLVVFLVKPDNHDAASADSKSGDDASQDLSEQEVSQTNDGQHDNQNEPYSDPDQITPQYEGENPNLANDLSGNIANYSYDGGMLKINTMINQYLSSGTCELKVTGSNGNIYTASSDIIASASTSACYDLGVAVSPDTYTIEIILKSDNKQGIITGEISL